MCYQLIKKYLFVFCFVVACIFCSAITNVAVAADTGVVNFSWLPNTEADLAGYKIHYGTVQGGPYNMEVDLGLPSPVEGRIHGSVTGLIEGETYFFVATAYNTTGLESDFTGEIEDSIPSPEPTDTTPPSGSIVIADGIVSTENSSVTLSLSASDSESGVTQMQFSNNNVDWSAPENFITSKGWVLSDGSGIKTVYVKYKDGAGNWSSSFSDTIELIEVSGATIVKVFGSAENSNFPGTIEDTFININEDNNFDSSNLNLYTWPVDSVANAIVMKIDLSALPDGANIQSAVLSVYMSGMSDSGGDDLYEVSVHKIVNHNPQLSQCTGYSYDGTNNWTANDSCYNSIPMAQADLASSEDVQSLDKELGYKSWSVTNMVREWVLNPETNFGLLLNSDSDASSSSNRYFSSSEADDPGQRPKLVIEYSLGTTAPATPAGFMVFD